MNIYDIENKLQDMVVALQNAGSVEIRKYRDKSNVDLLIAILLYAYGLRCTYVSCSFADIIELQRIEPMPVEPMPIVWIVMRIYNTIDIAEIHI